MPRYRSLSVVVAVLLLAACSPSKPAFNGTDLGPVDWGGDFALRAHTGKRVGSGDFRGKVAVIYFGYVDCPDVCGPTLAKLAQVRRSLGADAERLQVLFVTIDPRHDTPERLAQFVAKFDPSFIGLTGTPAEIAAVARDYKVSYREGQAHEHGHAHTAPDHSGGMLVKDANGKLRLYFGADASVADVEHDIRVLLKQRA